MKKIILYTLLIWPFIWGNVDQRFQTGQIIHFPKIYLQCIEVLLIFFIIVYAFAKTDKNNIKSVNYLIKVIFIVSILGVFSSLINESMLRGAFQTIYKVNRPLLLLLAVILLNFDIKELKNIIIFCFVIAIINNFAVLYQYYIIGYEHADYMTGFMSNSHNIHNFISLVIIFCVIVLNKYLEKNSHKILILSLILLLSFSLVLPGYLKGIAITVGTLLLIFLIEPIVTKKLYVSILIRNSIIGIVIVGALIQTLILIKPQYYYRITDGFLNIPYIGPVQGWGNLFNTFFDNPEYILYGMGPAKGVGVYAATHPIPNRESEWSREVFYIDQLSSTNISLNSIAALKKTSVYLGLLSEFGIIACGILFYYFYKMMMVLKSFFSSGNTYISIFSKWAFFGFILIFANGAVNMSSSYFRQSLMFPLLIVTGILISNSSKISNHA